jgi:AmmeMemoRadiSam system protein B
MNIRPPAFAGTLYEPDTQRLLAQVEAWLEDKPAHYHARAPKALIVPHSAYHYSATTAALAYHYLEAVYDKIKRVVILGPSHKCPIDSMALPNVDAFSSPLGLVKVDKVSTASLYHYAAVEQNDDAHANVHSIECQLPFLQVALDSFEIVPFVVGNCDPANVADVLRTLWGGEETLIVVSSGFSRNQPYDAVIQNDLQSARRIEQRDAHFQYSQACGYTGLNALLMVAAEKSLQSRCLGLTTSAARSGKKDRVRGFGAFVFY